MSLLMQALKKAERARQSGLQEEDLPDDTGEGGQVAARQAGDDTVSGSPLPDAPDAPHASLAPAGRMPGSAGGGLELSLEPLDAPPARSESSPSASPSAPAPAPPPRPAIEPAIEATHNPVPPQARHEGAARRAESGDIPVADARAAARPAGADASIRRGPGAPERRAMPRTAPAQEEAASGVDLSRLRVAGLAGVLVIVAGTCGYLYWQAVNGPGPGASLPMVPMPPPSATGATSAGGDGGIVVAPSGAPFGPLGPAAPASDAAAAQPPAAAPPATTAPPPSAPASTAPPAAETPVTVRPATRAGGAATPAAPTAAQLAAIEDPEVRREAMRDAIERTERAQRMEPSSAEAPAVPDDGLPAPATAPAAADAAPRGDVQVTRGTSRPMISPSVQAGYAAFNAGDLAAAGRHYGSALRNDPNNRDALLGTAAIAVRERRDDEAARVYARLLAIDPRDTEAIAGLAALRPGDGDRAEVRLKGVLRDNPDAAPIHFALGNLYARQRRWQEAQQAYFQAWSAAPGNADYAFNLAVGLDRLNQTRLAREYYQRALALAGGGAAAFDRAALQRRLLELDSAVAPAAGAPAPATAPATVQAPQSAPAPAAAGN